MVATLLLSLFSGVGNAWAWGNGGDTRSAYLKKLALEEPNFSHEESFTVNLAPVITGTGWGLGTHDYILEHAIAQAIRAGADVSWIDVALAQRSTSDADYLAEARQRFYPWGHHWSGTAGAGKAPRDIGILYKEILDALNAGDQETASRKLGWVAHLMGDLSMPMHVVTYSSIIPVSRQSGLHQAAESDLNYLHRFSIGTAPAQWPDDLKAVVNASLPNASLITTETAPQQVRKIWFGNSYAKPSMAGKPAREVTILVASRIRSTYGKAFWQNWATVWQKDMVPNGSGSLRPGTGTDYLIRNSPGMMSRASDGIASLIVTLSDPRTRALGIDQLQEPLMRVAAPKRTIIKKKSKLGKQILKARGKKRTQLRKKYLSIPKTLLYKATITIRDASGQPAVTQPVVVSWTNVQGKVLSTATVWTDAQGKLIKTYNLKTPKIKTAYYLTASLPTSNLSETYRKAFVVDPKMHKPRLK